MPALMRPIRNAFSIARSTAPAFTGINGLIDMTGAGTKAGQRVDEVGSLRVAAIWIANTVLADEIASLTMRLIEKGDQTRVPRTPPALRPLWSDEPNPDQTRFGIDATETFSMMLWGASYTMLGWVRSGALDMRLPLDPSKIRLERMDDGGLRLRSAGQGELENHPDQRPAFEYVPLYNLPGRLDPVSPVRMAAELAGLSLAYEETAARLMGRGMNPTAIVTTGEMMSDEQAQQLSSRMERLYGGATRAGRVAVLGGKDTKLERLTMSMADAEFVAQNDRVFSLLLAMWRVPPTVVGMVDKPSTWGTGIAEFSRGLERFTLRPIVQRRQAAHQKYITRWIDPNLQVKYIFDSMMSASPTERVAMQTAMLNAGMTSRERVLAQNDEPPFGPDETVYTQLAMAGRDDRELARLNQRAAAYATLVKAGVEPDSAAAAVGFDPGELRHTGRIPNTVQPAAGA